MRTRTRWAWPTVLLVACGSGQDDCRKKDGDVIGILAAGAASTVVVMSYNIFHDDESDERAIPGWSERRGIVVDSIRREHPDIVGLQEAYIWQVEYLVDKLPEYTFFGRGREDDGDGESVSILFKEDTFELLDSGHFWFSGHPDTAGSKGGDSWGNMSTPRITTWVRLKKKGTEFPFYVFNTHFPSESTADDDARARKMSATLLADRIAVRAHTDEHFIVTGDFNTQDSELPIRYLVGTASSCADEMVCPVPAPMTPVKMIDAWRVDHPSGEGGTRCSNVADAPDGNRIDYIFGWNPDTGGLCDAASNHCNPPKIWNTMAIPPLPSCGSDHRPVIATFMLPLIVLDGA